MPKAGNWKTIRIYYDGTCAESNWQGDCKYMQGCEAVQVPPHGDLIDRDVLGRFKELITTDVPGGKLTHEYVSMAAVRNVKTIIPASKEVNNEKD